MPRRPPNWWPTLSGSKPFEYWRQHLKTMRGQWAPFQSLIDLTDDDQAIANDMIVEVEAE